MKKWISIGFFLLLFSSHSYAITSVNCGGVDQDCDGYTTDGSGPGDDFDCDDTNRLMPDMPWIKTGCTGYQAKKCNVATGAYGACTTPTNGGTEYYIHCDDGDDAGAGTFADPFLTFLNFSSYINTSEPATYVGIPAGGTIWHLGGSCTDTYNDTPTRPAHYTRADGSAGNLKKIWGVLDTDGLPATTIDVSLTCDGTPDCPAVALVGATYLDVRGLEVAGGVSNATVDGIDGSGIISDGDNNNLIANVIHGNHGSEGNNVSGISLVDSPDGWVVRNNIVYDNNDTGANGAENERQIVLYTGSGNVVTRNHIYNTVATSHADTAGCLAWKHGESGASNEISYNILENCNFSGIGSGNSGTHIHHNLVLNSETCVSLRNFGGTSYVRDNLVEYNTCYNASGSPYFWHEPEVSGGLAGTTTFNNNIIVANVASFGHYDSIFTVWPDNNTNWNTYNDGTLIESDNNCFYNAGAGVLMFAGGSSNFTLAQWRAEASSNYDQASVVNLDPTLDSAYASTANCTTMGWREAAGGGGGGGDTLNRQLMLGVGF